MDTKKCGKCDVVKSLSDFYKGISPCKACQALYAKAYYAEKHAVVAVRRTCTRCWRTKLVDAFGKSLTACKTCINVYQVEYREKNRERKRVEAKERYKTHGHTRRTYAAEYRQRNRDELNARQREYAKQQDRVERDRELRKSYAEKLTDAYVRRAITHGTPIKPEQVPQAMIEAKRVQLQILRRIKDGTNTRVESKEGGTAVA
jgi:phage-related minor tail protein